MNKIILCNLTMRQRDMLGSPLRSDSFWKIDQIMQGLCKSQIREKKHTRDSRIKFKKGLKLSKNTIGSRSIRKEKKYTSLNFQPFSTLCLNGHLKMLSFPLAQPYSKHASCMLNPKKNINHAMSHEIQNFSQLKTITILRNTL